MFLNKIIRNIFLCSLALVVIFQVFNVFYIYPAFTNILLNYSEAEAIRLATHLKPTVGLNPPGDGSLIYYKGELQEMEGTFGLAKEKI